MVAIVETYSKPSAKSLTNCRLCDGTSFVTFLDLGLQPLANNLCLIEHHDERFPLRVVRCSNCGLVQLDTIVDPSSLFSHYLYKPSRSLKTIEHFKRLSEVTTSKFAHKFTANSVHNSPQSDSLAVDIGSNDGCLLGFLKAKGWKIVGIDPAKNLAEEATANGVETLPLFFNETAVDQIISRFGQALLVTANNVFAHTPDWHEFVRCTSRLLQQDGLLAIEFPYAPFMLTDGTFDLCYFEHYSYPAIGAVDRLYKSVGMQVVDVEMLPTIHGGSVRVWIGHNDFDGYNYHQHSPEVDKLIESEKITYSLDACLRFGEKVEGIRDRFVKTIRELRARGERVIGYTAPAKAVTLVEYAGLTVNDIEYIIDDNPLKQNHLLPGSHIPVVASGYNFNSIDAVVVFAWNVTEDILCKIPSSAEIITLKSVQK